MSKSIKFNAGKVQYDEDTKKCTPLPHKGVVTVSPSTEDEGFFDFSWTPKSDSGLEKDELLLIPGDMTFKAVKSCKTGRVVALTFLSSGDKSLYWLQDVGDSDELEKWTEKDLALVASVQELLAPQDEEEDEKAAEEPAATQDTPAQSTSGQNQALSEIDHYPVSSLSDVLTEDHVTTFLSTLSDEDIRSRFGDMLPESVEPTRDAISEVVRSEFFRGANAELSMNISQNNIGSILASSFGYEYTGEGLDAFLKGIRDAEKKEKEKESENK